MKRKYDVIGYIVALVILILLVGSTSITNAETKIKASTSTDLAASGANTTILRLIPRYEIKTPDLWFEAAAEATTVINNSGSAAIRENFATLAHKRGPYVAAGGVVTSVYSATNVRAITTNLSMEIEIRRGRKVFHSYLSGISLAAAGDDYALGLSGTHEVTTDAVADGVDFDVEDEFKRLRISFESYPREMDAVADVVNETISVNYNLDGLALKSVGFDFLSEVKANDITCTSDMSYRKGGD
jgi:hypothetical protein